MEENKREKIITILVSNDELNAIEGLCTVDFERDYERKQKCISLVLDIWSKLVHEYDKIDK